MFYTGWNTDVVNAPFKTEMGLATLDEDGINYVKNHHPILPLDIVDPISIGYMDIFRKDNEYIMIYESNLGWTNDNPKNGYKFIFKIATSHDGVTWKKLNKICFPLSDNEYVFSRPSIIRINKIFHMWYCYKIKNKYLIGHAESNDGLEWERKDDVCGL